MRKQLQQLIRTMAAENITWGEERIANELKLKLGIRIAPSTVRKYLDRGNGPERRDPTQRWLTFIRNHAQAIVACDFARWYTARFVSFTTVSRDILRLSGPCSNSGKRCRGTTRIVSRSTIMTASFPVDWTKR